MSIMENRRYTWTLFIFQVIISFQATVLLYKWLIIYRIRRININLSILYLFTTKIILIFLKKNKVRTNNILGPKLYLYYDSMTSENIVLDLPLISCPRCVIMAVLLSLSFVCRTRKFYFSFIESKTW